MSIAAYWIEGDPFFCGEKIREVAVSLEKEAGSLESSSVTLSDTPISDLLSKALSKPFFSAHQIFTVTDPQELKAEEVEGVSAYLKNPAPFTTLLFRAESSEEGGRADRISKEGTALVALIRKCGGQILQQDGNSSSGLGRFIQEKIRRAGKTMDSGLQKKLEQEWAEFPAMLDSLIENLILYAGNEKNITLEMGSHFEEAAVRGDRFQLLDAITERRGSEALTIMARLLDAEDEAPALLSFLSGQIKLFAQAIRMREEGRPDQEIFTRLKFSSGRAFHFTKKLRNYSRERAEGLASGLFFLDRAIKRGDAEPRSGLEKWILAACSEKANTDSMESVFA